MHNKGKAIVLSSLRYKENDLIVKCYTNHRGVVSYLQKGILKTQKSRIRAVYFQPLSQLELDENYQVNRSLQYLKDIKCYYPYKSLHTNIYKASLSVFLAEILANVLREEEPNTPLFEFLEAACQFLDTQQQFSNFHLMFLLRLTKYLGFYPETTAQNKSFFNLESGTFENEKTSMYAVDGMQKELFSHLMRLDFESVNTVKLNALQRREFLKTLLLYFELHLGGFKKPKSLQVFNDVFH
jgi:DNA repair protein RecO (recombination protein O)